MTSPGPSRLNIGMWNIHGLISVEGNKLDDPTFLSQIEGLDLICLVETHHSPLANLAVAGYTVTQAHRPKHKRATRYTGGMAILTSHAIDACTTVTSLHHECTHVQVLRGVNGTTPEQPSNFIFTYIPPSNSQTDLERAYKVTDRITATIQSLPLHQPIIVMGDFNARVRQWQNTIMDTDGCMQLDGPLDEGLDGGIFLHALREACDEDTNMGGRVLKDLCQLHDLTIVNGTSLGDSLGSLTCHTPTGHSTVDYLLTNPAAWAETAGFQVGDWLPLLSDHCLLQARISTYSTRHGPETPSPRLLDSDPPGKKAPVR